MSMNIVVVGAGGAGVACALRAAQLGCNVLLLEKDLATPSTTEIGGGMVVGVGTPQQKARGIVDSPALLFRDIMEKNNGQANADLVNAICAKSGLAFQFLSEVAGIAFELYQDILHGGMSVYRLHISAGGGPRLLAQLREAIPRSSNITLVDHASVCGLLTRDGTVTGVRAEISGKVEEYFSDATILACGGFGANREMVARFCPEISGAMYMGSLNNTGDAVTWGLTVGAALAHMSGYQGHSHATPGFPHGTHLAGGSLPALGAILVNLKGERFAREDQGYSEFARYILAQPEGRAVEIFDQRILNIARRLGVFDAAIKLGAVKKADSVSQLAEFFQLPVETLAHELHLYNESVYHGRDRFGRERFGEQLNPPFYAAVVAGALAHTQGGLAIDRHARVLAGTSGAPIPGLYAAGGAAEGISGDGATGYLTGNGLAQTFATGLIAAESAAGI